MYDYMQRHLHTVRGSEKLACGWSDRANWQEGAEKQDTAPPVRWRWHLAITKDGERHLSSDTECTQTYAPTRSEQVMLVPIGAPPYNHVELNFIVSIAHSRLAGHAII